MQVEIHHATEDVQVDEAVVHVEAQAAAPSGTATPASKPTDEASDEPEMTHTAMSSDVHELQDMHVEVKL